MDNISDSVYTSLVDKNHISQKDLRLKLLYNDYQNNMKLSYELEYLLANCESFYFSVAFISESGLATLKEKLSYYRKEVSKEKLLLQHI